MADLKNRNKKLEHDDLKYIWHPFTQMQEWAGENPVIIEQGKGSVLIDIYGKEYLDGISSLWTNVHGHQKQRLDLAIKEQLDKIAHTTMLGLSNVPAIRCAKKLIGIAPEGLTRVFYSDNGSTSVEIALKIAFQYHQQAPDGDPEKKKFISLVDAYHGDTIGSVSVGGINLFHTIYKPLLFDSFKAPAPYCYRCPFQENFPGCDYKCLQKAEEIMQEHHHEIAAMIVEPLVQGAAGILVHPPGYLKGIRELCNRYNIIMVADEVAVGFGKTGKMFACEHEEVVPDIMSLAKGISGGYLPLAATLVKEKIYNGFLRKYDEFKAFFHGHTYTGNPLACAVAIANLEIFEEEHVLENLGPKIELLKDRLRSFKQIDSVGDIRQSGFMVGIELVADKANRDPFESRLRVGHQVIMEARKRGLIIRPLGDVIVFMPPLAMTMNELARLCDITYESIELVTKNIYN